MNSLDLFSELEVIERSLHPSGLKTVLWIILVVIATCVPAWLQFRMRNMPLSVLVCVVLAGVCLWFKPPILDKTEQTRLEVRKNLLCGATNQQYEHTKKWAEICQSDLAQ